jgi:two-component system sensor histidine kinase and response regulator WspE
VDSSLLDLFRAELETHLPALNEGLLALEKDARDPKRLEALMRAAHSVKGAARIVGLDDAVQVAHVMEDCFVAAQKGTLTITSEAIDVLLRGVDALQRIGLPRDGEAASLPADALRQLVESIAAVRAGAPAPSAAPAAPPPPAAPPTVRPGGDLDAAESEALRPRIAELLRSGAAAIHFDLAAVRNVAPQGLALLARAARAAAKRQPPAALHLANASPEVRTLLRLTRLDAAFAADKRA